MDAAGADQHPLDPEIRPLGVPDVAELPLPAAREVAPGAHRVGGSRAAPRVMAAPLRSC